MELCIDTLPGALFASIAQLPKWSARCLNQIPLQGHIVSLALLLLLLFFFFFFLLVRC